MRCIHYITFMLVSAFSVFAEDLAQQPDAFTLDEAIAYGLAHSTASEIARLDEDIARTRVGQAAAQALPQLTLDATYRRLDEVQEVDFGEGSTALGTLDNYEVIAGVSQLIYSGGQVGAALRAARLAREHADVMRQTTDAQLVRDIKVQFYGLLLAAENVRVQSASVDQIKAYADQTVERRQHGAASEFELLTAQVRLANERPKLIEANNQHALASAAFATLLNHPGVVSVTGSLEQASFEWSCGEMEKLALHYRPELRSGDLRVRLGHEDIVNARSKGMPSIRAFFNYHGANAYQFLSFGDDWEWHWNAGLMLSWNIWDGNLTRQTVRQKHIAYAQYEAEYDSIRQGILLEVKQACLALAHARELIAASADSVALAERALAIAQTRYETGLSTYLEFTDANLALRTARLARAQALHDHAVALAQVAFACGMTNEENGREEVTEAN